MHVCMYVCVYFNNYMCFCLYPPLPLGTWFIVRQRAGRWSTWLSASTALAVKMLWFTSWTTSGLTSLRRLLIWCSRSTMQWRDSGSQWDPAKYCSTLYRWERRGILCNIIIISRVPGIFQCIERKKPLDGGLGTKLSIVLAFMTLQLPIYSRSSCYRRGISWHGNGAILDWYAISNSRDLYDLIVRFACGYYIMSGYVLLFDLVPVMNTFVHLCCRSKCECVCVCVWVRRGDCLWHAEDAAAPIQQGKLYLG